MDSGTGHCGEKNAVTMLTELFQLVFYMTSKDRMKGVDMEGRVLNIFYETITVFEETEFMASF
jgi:hypothetical protein